MNWKLIAAATAGAALLAGCASTGVMQIGQDRFMISDTNSMYWKGGEVLKDILVEANKFCSTKGKTVEVLNAQTNDAVSGVYGAVVGGGRSAAATIEFTCK